MTYQYKGKQYRLLGLARIKLFRWWFNCVIYKNETGTYVRLDSDFKRKFKRVA